MLHKWNGIEYIDIVRLSFCPTFLFYLVEQQKKLPRSQIFA